MARASDKNFTENRDIYFVLNNFLMKIVRFMR